MYKGDELSKKSSKRSHANDRGMMLARYGTTGSRTGKRSCCDESERVLPEYNVVDGEGSIHVGDPDRGE